MKRAARASVVVGILALALPSGAWASPCRGTKRLQLRWSQRSQSALISFSAADCDAPPSCTAANTAAAGVALTRPPLLITIKDAAGKTLSGEVNPADPACGMRCAQLVQATCSGGTDSYRVPGGFLRYLVSNRTSTTVMGRKLKIKASEPPDLTPPLTVTVQDAGGYTVELDLEKCRARKSATSSALTCS